MVGVLFGLRFFRVFWFGIFFKAVEGGFVWGIFLVGFVGFVKPSVLW